jgi:hypothetical protein
MALNDNMSSYFKTPGQEFFLSVAMGRIKGYESLYMVANAYGQDIADGTKQYGTIQEMI